jgi:hypothetical protein
MGMLDGLLKPKKSIEDLETETEHAEAEDRLESVNLSLAKKREAIKMLKEHGLTLDKFKDPNNPGSRETALSRAWTWLKTH